MNTVWTFPRCASRCAAGFILVLVVSACMPPTTNSENERRDEGFKFGDAKSHQAETEETKEAGNRGGFEFSSTRAAREKAEQKKKAAAERKAQRQPQK